MGLFRLLFTLVAAVVLIVVGIGAYLYFTDYAAKATITDRGSACPPGSITITPALLPSYHYATTLDCSIFPFVCKGYDVTYHVQTKQYQVKSGDKVVYDSATGQKDTVGLAQCAASNGLPVR
jgi:hypothetical protein